jgi:hypothetical protein
MGTISREHAAYLAGLIDGEGSILVEVREEAKAAGYRYTAIQGRVKIGNTCPMMIARISEILVASAEPIKFYYDYQNGARRGKRDSITILVAGDKSVMRLLDAVLPFLTTKREQAQALFDFVTWRQGLPPGTGRRLYTPEVVARASDLKNRLIEIRSRRYNLGVLSRKPHQVLPWSSPRGLPETTKAA